MTTLNKWKTLIGNRLLLTKPITDIQRIELTLVEISPSGKVGNFKRPDGGSFWSDLSDYKVLEILPDKP